VETRMDALPITQLEFMWICRSCGGLSGQPGQLSRPRDERVQRCSCRRTDEPTWPRFDFNEHVHLCECCLQEALPSGSKFSIWFCDPCRNLVTELNDELRKWLIPIGRHSFMVRTYDPPGALMLSGRDLYPSDGSVNGAAIDRFAKGLFGMSSSIDLLHEWSRATLLENLRDLAFPLSTDARLSEYLTAVRARSAEDSRFSKDAEFGRLKVHMLAGTTPSRSTESTEQ
jgi:hypothetical protein